MVMGNSTARISSIIVVWASILKSLFAEKQVMSECIEKFLTDIPIPWLESVQIN